MDAGENAPSGRDARAAAFHGMDELVRRPQEL